MPSHRRPSTPPTRPLPWRVLLSLTVIAALTSATVNSQLPLWMGLWCALTSLLTFVLYALDKRAARRQQWRIPESRLQLLGLAGGWPGALLAQGWLHHKNAKGPFQALFWLCVVVNLMLLAGLLRQLG